MIFNEENRKGHIAFDAMPETYRRIVMEMKTLKDKANDITKKKKTDRTTDELGELENIRIEIKDKQNKRDEELIAELNRYAEVANVKDFTFPMSNYVKDDKQIFTIDTTMWVNFYAIKNLQRSLRGLFDVKQANKHQIMSNVRLLLNTSRPLFIIRTDISGFYESIPQVPLLKKVDDNNLVNNKTKGMIHGILKEYNDQKDSTKIKADCGVPRGIGISSYLSEIYMHDIDEQIKNREEVIFYVRYVDDIFMILVGLPDKKTILQYYKDLKTLFLKYGLALKNNDSTEKKCKLINFYSSTADQEVTYLGYKIFMKKQPMKELVSTFKMSDDKFDRITKKIDAAFNHFEKVSMFDIKRAEKDLIDSLNLISGNYRLTKSKAMVKAGLYYGSDLLTDFEDLENLTGYLRTKSITPYSEVLKGTSDRTKYINRIEGKVQSIDFKRRWQERIMFKFNSKRLKEISNWL
ncbi:MAG: RNA-directed DNA polymerase [Bacteroidales bacterium]|jgi:FtsZ-binding cell division protein ZapB|nr:RNA-directed DNA polymerase [Bacteroidales bacterium]